MGKKTVYNAYCPTLNVADYGDSIEEVLESIKDGIQLAIECLLEEYKGKGSHRRLRHPDGRWTQIPIHTKPIPQGTLRKILRQAGISTEQLGQVY